MYASKHVTFYFINLLRNIANLLYFILNVFYFVNKFKCLFFVSRPINLNNIFMLVCTYIHTYVCMCAYWFHSTSTIRKVFSCRKIIFWTFFFGILVLKLKNILTCVNFHMRFNICMYCIKRFPFSNFNKTKCMWDNIDFVYSYWSYYEWNIIKFKRQSRLLCG